MKRLFTTPRPAKLSMALKIQQYRKARKSVLDFREVLLTSVMESLMCTGAEKRLI